MLPAASQTGAPGDPAHPHPLRPRGRDGAILRRWPACGSCPRAGGAHLRPRALVSSATRLYGEDGMKKLWGEVVPVPKPTCTSCTGASSCSAGVPGGLHAGHASHHVSYSTSRAGAFVGDMAASPCRPTLRARADAPARRRSRRLGALAAAHRGLAPASLGLTHFGAIEAVAAQLAAGARGPPRPIPLAASTPRGIRRRHAREARAEAPDVAVTYAQAAPLELSGWA